jgi:hypothetical protein
MTCPGKFSQEVERRALRQSLLRLNGWRKLQPLGHSYIKCIIILPSIFLRNKGFALARDKTQRRRILKSMSILPMS